MKTQNELIEKVNEIYRWVDEQIAASDEQNNCNACGKCCDFKTYGHHLYVTAPEMLYFTQKISPESIKPMTGGVCPYLTGGKCSIHEYRFSGCRIYNCKGSSDFQNDLSEQTIKKFKNLCKTCEIPYRYMELPQALNGNAKIKM